MTPGTVRCNWCGRLSTHDADCPHGWRKPSAAPVEPAVPEGEDRTEEDGE